MTATNGIDKARAIEAKLRGARASLQAILLDGYDATAEPWRDLVRQRMSDFDEGLMAAAHKLLVAADAVNDGMAMMWMCGGVRPG